MANKMLIDASHQEETRVVVVHGNRIEEFDFESQHKKQIRGNIYLARVTRVEPSLQAAFVEYGGNRHGFLAFSEIHPDYYQIPFADRQALLEAEAADHADEDEEDEAPRPARENNRDNGRNKRRDRGSRINQNAEQSADGEAVSTASSDVENQELAAEGADSPSPTVMEMTIEGDAISEDASAGETSEAQERPRRSRRDKNEDDDSDGHIEEQEVIESIGAEDAMEEMPMRRRTSRRQYKIQEVIKRRQVLLVQVVKEERGNKGAALTTYLSLAGRYSVLMPNTGRGGGISRKITSVQDRKRLKDVVKELEVPQGMGVILRTAGANRTKVEIKRDYEYLMRAWETVRNLTLQSQAPALVYEEGSLIKRSIRDLYNKDISEILVAGENGYREAKDFMRMLMPSHAKMVQPYRDSTPIFARAGIEPQLDRMLQPHVTLKSGGYIIINQTEALVSVDVNSGRSTREHSIEDTALQTNLEAAEEVARQLRLRDLAGLVVIDFIDMEEKRNNRAVEKRLKDNLKNDRARIQVGRISHFGLLEMSRQRIRASVLESTMQVCTHCGGTGHVRSESSVALHVIRTIEEYLLRSATNDLIVKTSVATALYVLNQKRQTLLDLEARFGLTIILEADESVGAQHVVIDKSDLATGTPREIIAPAFIETPEDLADLDVVEIENVEIDAENSDDEDEGEGEAAEKSQGSSRKNEAKSERSEKDDGDHKRKRRRRRRGRKSDDAEDTSGSVSAGDTERTDGVEPEGEIADGIKSAKVDEDNDQKKRRRGRRGGRRNRETEMEANGDAMTAQIQAEVTDPFAVAMQPDAITEEAETPKVTKPRGRKPKAKADVAADIETVVAEAPKEKAAPKTRGRKPKVVAQAIAGQTVETEVASVKHEKPANEQAIQSEAVIPGEPVVSSSTGEEREVDGKPRKGGWWQRKGFF